MKWAIALPSWHVAGPLYWTGAVVMEHEVFQPIVSLDPADAKRWASDEEASHAVTSLDSRIWDQGFALVELPDAPSTDAGRRRLSGRPHGDLGLSRYVNLDGSPAYPADGVKS